MSISFCLTSYEIWSSKTVEIPSFWVTVSRICLPQWVRPKSSSNFSNPRTIMKISIKTAKRKKKERKITNWSRSKAKSRKMNLVKALRNLQLLGLMSKPLLRLCLRAKRHKANRNNLRNTLRKIAMLTHQNTKVRMSTRRSTQ